MLTLRATLEPNGYVTLPPTLRHEYPVTVLVTFLDDPAPVQAEGNAATTLAMLKFPAFRALPKADPMEIEQRIDQLRSDWGDE